MKINRSWYRKINNGISQLKGWCRPSSQRRPKTSLLIRATGRVAGFSPDCEECRTLKERIRELSEDPIYSSRITRQEYKKYLGVVKSITKHLKRKHGLVEEKQYIKRFVTMGAVLGLALVLSGCVLVNFGITLLVLSVTLPALVVRVIIGYAVGYLMDRRAKKQGRVI